MNTVIIVRRWFDQYNGNMYHTLRVVYRGTVHETTNMHYGGDRSDFLRTAEEVLRNRKTLSAGDALGITDYEAIVNDPTAIMDCATVLRRKDLHHNGRIVLNS